MSDDSNDCGIHYNSKPCCECAEIKRNNAELPPPMLTKREYFAITALQGLLANHQSDGDPETQSTWAVKCADTLIEALNYKDKDK